MPSSASSTSSLGIFKVFQLVWLLLSTKVITGLANSMGSSTMPLILKNNYGLTEMYLGYIMSSMSFFNAIVNGIFAIIYAFNYLYMHLIIYILFDCRIIPGSYHKILWRSSSKGHWNLFSYYDYPSPFPNTGFIAINSFIVVYEWLVGVFKFIVYSINFSICIINFDHWWIN